MLPPGRARLLTKPLGEAKAKAKALYLCPDSLVIANVTRINASALNAGIATMWGAREFS
jgi:putative ABC transport system substrate-binding protein